MAPMIDEQNKIDDIKRCAHKVIDVKHHEGEGERGRKGVMERGGRDVNRLINLQFSCSCTSDL